MPVVSRQSIELNHSLIIDFASEPVLVLGAEAWSIQFVWTSSATGTFYVEASHDKTNWTVLIGQEVFATGAAGSGLSASAGGRTAFDYLRVRWDETAGTSTGAVTITARVIGTYNE